MAQCNRCGRTLKNPDYIEIGYGKVCAAKMGITAHTKKKDKRVGNPKAPETPEERR